LRKKFTKTLSYLEGSRSFKVIDVDKSKKPVTNAVLCCDNHHVCRPTYLQPFSHYTSQYSGKIMSFKNVPLFDALVQEEPLHPARNTKFCHD